MWKLFLVVVATLILAQTYGAYGANLTQLTQLLSQKPLAELVKDDSKMDQVKAELKKLLGGDEHFDSIFADALHVLRERGSTADLHNPIDTPSIRLLQWMLINPKLDEPQKQIRKRVLALLVETSKEPNRTGLDATRALDNAFTLSPNGWPIDLYGVPQFTADLSVSSARHLVGDGLRQVIALHAPYADFAFDSLSKALKTYETDGNQDNQDKQAAAHAFGNLAASDSSYAHRSQQILEEVALNTDFGTDGMSQTLAIREMSAIIAKRGLDESMTHVFEQIIARPITEGPGSGVQATALLELEKISHKHSLPISISSALEEYLVRTKAAAADNPFLKNLRGTATELVMISKAEARLAAAEEAESAETMPTSKTKQSKSKRVRKAPGDCTKPLTDGNS